MLKQLLILLVLLTASYSLPQAQYLTEADCRVTTLPTATNYDMLPTVEEQLKYGNPPEWTGDDLSSPEVRKGIVVNAYWIALDCLEKCGGDAALAKVMFSENRELCDIAASQNQGRAPTGIPTLLTGVQTRYRGEYGYCGIYAEVGSSEGSGAQYSQIQRRPNVSARSTITAVRHFWPEGVYRELKEETLIYPNLGVARVVERYQPPIYRPEAELEEYNCEIEIYPAVFERGEYFMEGEKESSQGPWARSPLEAMVYINLHEFGHFEYYLIKHTNLWHFPKLDNSEEEFDAYASSVMRCIKEDR